MIMLGILKPLFESFLLLKVHKQSAEQTNGATDEIIA